MVVVTVILAARVTAFSLGNLQGYGFVGATVTQLDNGVIMVTYVGGSAASSAEYLNWTIDGVEQTSLI